MWAYRVGHTCGRDAAAGYVNGERVMGRFDRSTTPRAAGDAANGAHTIVRAQRLAASGNVAQALVLFRDIVREGNPRDRQAACVGAGNAYLAMQRYELAEACYEQAAGAGWDPDLFAESLQNLGIARYVRGDRSGACAAMQELAVLDHPVFSPLARDNLEVLFGLAVF